MAPAPGGMCPEDAVPREGRQASHRRTHTVIHSQEAPGESHPQGQTVGGGGQGLEGGGMLSGDRGSVWWMYRPGDSGGAAARQCEWVSSTPVTPQHPTDASGTTTSQGSTVHSLNIGPTGKGS